MKKRQDKLEITIKQDLDNSTEGIRFFDEDRGVGVNKIARIVFKCSPASIILRVQAFRNFGKITILMEIERQLVNSIRSMLAYIIYLGKEISMQEDIASLAKEALEIFYTLGAEDDVKNLQEILRNQVQ